jgi:hypothetical protein
MEEIGTLILRDLESDGDAVVIVRRHADCVAICMSQKKGSDAELVLSVADARRIWNLIGGALSEKTS